MDFHEIIKSLAVSESETNTAKVIEADGETSKVKTFLILHLCGFHLQMKVSTFLVLPVVQPDLGRMLGLLGLPQLLNHYLGEW